MIPTNSWLLNIQNYRCRSQSKDPNNKAALACANLLPTAYYNDWVYVLVSGCVVLASFHNENIQMKGGIIPHSDCKTINIKGNSFFGVVPTSHWHCHVSALHVRECRSQL